MLKKKKWNFKGKTKGRTWSSSSSVQLDWGFSRSDMCVSLSLWYVAWLVIQDTPSISSFFWVPSKSKTVDHIQNFMQLTEAFEASILCSHN
jgi:hypothetical protein